MMGRNLAGALAATLLVTAGCAARPDPAPADPQQAWWEQMQTLCGQAFAGELAVFDPALDAGWRDVQVVMHVRECAPAEIRIPLHVGENRSRTWVLTRTDEGVRLKHDHRYPDGREETMSQYGGHTVDTGSAARQEFPAGESTRELFLANDHPTGVHNVWAMEVRTGERFSYVLTRPGRHFQVDFDLTSPVEPPPPPWVVEPRQPE
jgi:hypothetical protein